MARNKPPNLSPSGVKNVRRCQSRWFFEKVLGIRPETAPHLTLGSAVHSAIEHYLLEGEWQPGPTEPPQARAYHRRVLQIAQSGQRYLDELRPRVACGAAEVERLYKIPPKSGLGPLPIYCITDVVDREARRVLDHKTTSNLYSPYRPTPRKLATDEQMSWYGYLEFLDDPGDFEVRHVYYSTGSVGSDASPWVPVSWDAAATNAAMFVETSRIMFDLWAQVDNVKDVPYNLDACGDYKGCPHRNICPHFAAGPSVSVLAPSQKGDGMSFFKDLLKKNDAPASEPAPAPTPEPAPAPTPEPAPATGQVLPPDTPGAVKVTTAMLDEISDAIYVTLEHSAQGSEVKAWLDSTEGRAKLVAIGFGVNHVPQILGHLGLDLDSAPADLAPALKPAPATSIDLQYAEIHALLAKNGGRMDLEHADVKAALLTISGKKRLGAKIRDSVLGQLYRDGIADSSKTEIWLRTDAKPAPAPATPEPAPAPEPTPEPTPEPAPAPAAPPAPVSNPTPALAQAPTWATTAFMVGCLPSSAVPMLTFDAAFEVYFQEVAQENGVPSYLVVKYNEGPRQVASRIQADVREGKLRPTPGFIVLPNTHPIAPYLEQMFPQATIWRGLA